MSLGYLGMEAADPRRWGAFSEEVLGAPVTHAGEDGTQYIRLDERVFRVAVHPGTDGRLAYLGWELKDAAALDAALERLKAHGVAVVRPTDRRQCEARGVMDFVALEDPAGIRNELFYGSTMLSDPVPLTRDISGFAALGHVVLGAKDLRASERFYTEVLGLKVSDYIEFPYGDIQLSAVFLRCADGREHSLALQNLGEGLHHALLEVRSLDDVGRTLDLCQDKKVPIAESLGRHSNDLMISFYMESPNGVQIECGFGGIRVDEATWRVRRMNAGSLWGHRVAR